MVRLHTRTLLRIVWIGSVHICNDLGPCFVHLFLLCQFAIFQLKKKNFLLCNSLLDIARSRPPVDEMWANFNRLNCVLAPSDRDNPEEFQGTYNILESVKLSVSKV